MGTLYKNKSKKSSKYEAKASEDSKNFSEDIIDFLLNDGIPSPFLTSHVDLFPEIRKHSKYTSKDKAIHKELQNASSKETALEPKKSEDNKEKGSTSKKKTTKNKAVRGSPSPRHVTRTAYKNQDLESPVHIVNDFFGSLDWYNSNKNYYDKKLQLVLNDFEYSKSSDTDKGKNYYDYLLLDSRVSNLTEWPGFVRAVFYVGKGKNQRALDHTKEAAKIWMMGGTSTSKKISRILDIWRGNEAVLVFTVADGLVETEAKTREALVIEALGKQRLCNKINGSFYGIAAVLNAREKHEIGTTLLVKARERFIVHEADQLFAPVRLNKQPKNKDEADLIFAPVGMGQQSKAKDRTNNYLN